MFLNHRGSLPLLLFSSRNYKNWGEAKIMEKGSSQIVLEISIGTSYRGWLFMRIS